MLLLLFVVIVVVVFVVVVFFSAAAAAAAVASSVFYIRKVALAAKSSKNVHTNPEVIKLGRSHSHGAKVGSDQTKK